MDSALLIVVVTALAYACVRLILRWTLNRQLLDIPNERSSHTRPTPHGGGLGIGLITLLGCLIYLLTEYRSALLPILTYIVAGAMVMVVGWIDDVRPLRSLHRLMIQLGAALAMIVTTGYWQIIDVPLLGVINIGPLGILLTLLWVIGLINAFNFMDGIDGIAGGVSVVAGFAWALIAALTSSSTSDFVRLLGLLMAASSLGFLGLNWSPAKIFMGDVGSTFLGFTFAVVPLLLNADDPKLPVAGAILVWPFLFDTALTIIRRLRRGENILTAHRSHLYQQLVSAGQSHARVSVLYIAFAVLGAALAWGWLTDSTLAEIAIMIGLPLLAVGYALAVRRYVLSHA